jgi:hypothetical protein
LLYRKEKETSRNPKYTSSEGGSNSQRFDKHGNPIWPSNRGFAGEPVTQILQSGTRVDRCGYDGGTFVSPEGTPYSQRALAPGTEKKPYTIFEVMKPIAVQGGKQPLGLVKKAEECNMNLVCQFLNCWNKEY